MKLLLDTHILLWALQDSPQLTASTRELLEAPANELYVSTASLWEIAIKHTRRPKDLPLSAEEVHEVLATTRAQLLNITPQHLLKLAQLPTHHNDPFDRILVAQALSEPLRLLTHDAVVAQYSDAIIRV